MSDLLIEKIAPELKQALEQRALEHGRSVSDEAKSVLGEAVRGPSEPIKMGMGTWLFSLLPDEFRGDDLVFEVPGEMRDPPDFD